MLTAINERKQNSGPEESNVGAANTLPWFEGFPAVEIVLLRVCIQAPDHYKQPLFIIIYTSATTTVMRFESWMMGFRLVALGKVLAMMGQNREM